MAERVKKTFGEKAVRFFLNLKPEFTLPADFEFLMPYQSDETVRVTKKFFKKFYDDTAPRVLIAGINPGRFGAGTTGIAFTDPIRLQEKCGIENDFPKKPELSSIFIYEMIGEAGGAEKFYSRFFLSAVCPIGFTRHGKNINYYDDKNLIRSSREFIVDSLTTQAAFGAAKEVVICLGEGKNLEYLTALNKELKLFREILPLAHPRFIMQYRRKQLKDYLLKYIDTLEKAVKKSGS